MRAARVEAEWSVWMRAGMDGDAAAYRRLLDALSPWLRGVVGRGFARNGLGHADVEDVVQETLIAIHLKRHTWDRAESLAPWVQAIARNKLIDALRKRGRRITVSVDDFAEVLAAEPEPEPLAARDVDRMMETLAPRQRDIVRAVTLEDQSIRDTAERLSMSEGAVRVALHRALKALAALHGRRP